MKVHVRLLRSSCAIIYGLKKDRNTAAENLFLILIVMFLRWDNFNKLPQNVLQKRRRRQ